MDTCKGKFCPRIGKKCIEHKCSDYQHILGMHPQSGEHIDLWDCAVRIHNILLLDNSKLLRESGAAIESLRNETSVHTLQGVGRVLSAFSNRAKLENKS